MNNNEEHKTVALGDLITIEEAKDLVKFVASEHHFTPHNLIMKWVDKQPQVLARFKNHGVIKAFGCYLFEHYLGIK